MKNDYKNSLVHIPLHLYYCIVQGGPNGKVLASAETVTIILLNRAWRLFNTHSTTSYRINDPVRLFFFMIFFQPVFPILKYCLSLEYLCTFIHFLDFLPLFMLIRLFGTQEYSQELHLLVVCVVDRRLGKIHV